MNSYTLQKVNSESRIFQPTIDSPNLKREVAQPVRSPQIESPPTGMWDGIMPYFVFPVTASAISLFIDRRMIPEKKIKQTPIRIEHHIHTVSQPQRSLGYRAKIPRWLKLLIAIVLPPLAVYSVRGFHISLWVNIALTLFGYWLGIFHALFLVLINRKSD